MSRFCAEPFERRAPNFGYFVRKKPSAENHVNRAVYSDVLIHYGISGQRWGIRRFQNEDRTLTEAGKERYQKHPKEDRKETRAKRKAEKEAQKPESSRWKSKEAGFLSDEELNRRNSRLQREQQYRQMTEGRGKKFLRGFGKAANKILIGSLIGASAGFVGKNYASMIDNGARFLNDNIGFMNLKVNEKK